MFFVQNAQKPADAFEPEMKRKALRSLLWFGMISITMLFAGLTSAYLVRQGEGKWVEFALPKFFYISSLVILLSSVSMQWALNAIKKNNTRQLKNAMVITVILGSAFILTQYMAWSELYNNGIVFTGRISDIKTEFNYVPSGSEKLEEASSVGNVAGSFLYVLTGLHIAHLFAGVIALIIVFSRALKGKYSAVNYNGVRMCTIYWHFLDGLWLYLFLFLLYIR
jgi:cytochrome c oxidase subunit 3